MPFLRKEGQRTLVRLRCHVVHAPKPAFTAVVEVLPDDRTDQPMTRPIACTCLAGALAAGVVLSATQSPTSPRLAGEAPAPASVLSLWYRAPASDHPLLPVGASPESRQAATAEWVRALPVGNGRLGAMVFGGIVHERLQLNEDTLWAGRPYDPVNPRAKDALPEVRRLLAERKYPEAAKLVGAKVMSKPLAQMPYETVGDVALTFPEVDSVENYMRDLDLATATAHVSYTSGGVTFSREVFASAPDQVIVMRLTASRPGQISFQARMQTPQRATVEATAEGDLVMRGVNGDGPGTTADGRPMTGALRFEARVRVVTSGGTRSASGDAVVVRDADAVTLLIAAATSYRTYEDVSADPAAASRRCSIQPRRRASIRCAPRTSAITSSCSIASRSISDPRSVCRLTSACVGSATGTIPVLPRSISSTAATC